MSSHPRPIHEMEAKWQQYWQERGTYRAQTGSSAEPFYGLVEFPYPSGDGLHVGHPRSYTAIDIVTRKRRMEGKNVLYPMGWDAFGLPTENYAIKHKIKPADATKKNEANFRRQIQSIGFGFDWSREIDTTDPAYYKWTQWQFLQFVKSGMAYKAASVINWCPSCKIGLANEEAQGGVCERCGGPVEQRQKNQWMIRITDYADRLLQDLSSVDYLDKIASQQINWIGKSTGAEIAFRLAKFDTVLVSTNNTSKVARVRKLLGATLPMVKVVTPRDLGIEARDVEEGKDMEENARRKARAYADVSGLPTIGMDTGFVIAGETLETSTPKRNALGGEDERTLSQEEQATRMDAFYREIARKHGGSVDAYWLDVAVLHLPDGTEDVAWNKREVILTDIRHGEMDAYFPVRGLYRVKANGKYVAEQSEDEAVYQELWPLALSLTKLCSDEVRVFTTRPDTLFGVTYVVLAPEHALVARLLQEGRVTNQEAVKAYIEKTRLSSDLERQSKTEKTGVALEGVTFAHPVTGEALPVWIADYVLASYGTGAVMAVPAHDERDFAFAKTFGLPIKQVVAPIVVQMGEYAPREDVPTQSRMVVTAIVHRMDTDEYLVQRMSDGRVGFCGGGIDDGETDEQAIRREVAEETGYTNLERVERVGMVCGNGHKPKKSTNCLDPDVCFLVEVRGEPNGALSDEEQATHTNVWYSRDEVAAQINLTHHAYLWDVYTQGTACETSMGIALQSRFLDGLPSWKAKEEMITWLEEHGCGEAKSTYKLRDWVFSRQRYWGEPIPLVYCETCAQKKQKALLIHGFEGSGEGNWFPWMKRELEARGFEVFAPTMSTAFHPDLEAWMQELMPFMDQLGDDDIIVGHSLGSKAALHLIERANKKIGSVFLVASAIGQVEQCDWERFAMEWQGSDIETLKRFWEVSYDWEKVSALVERKHAITSDDDPYISAYMHKDIPAGWYKQTWHGFGHFGAQEIPELRDRLLTSQVTGWVPLPDSTLPLTLPDVEAYEPTDTGDSPLAAIESWVHTTCPKCGGAARRETDTMPNWAGSSWYFLRYCDPHNTEAFASREAMKYWLPVDLYNGGMEHTTLHLLYSRFWYKFLFDMGYIPEECGSEPYAKRRSHNMILAQDGTKMSKSKGNVVNPDDVIREYGADVFRVYEMFIGPYDQVAMWNTQGMEGVRRFLDKVWSVMTTGADVSEASLETLYHQSLKKIGEQIDALQFNTCISQLMILTNAFVEAGGVPVRFRKGFVQMLAPFAPHLAEELWQEVLGEKASVHASGAGWPAHDASKIVAATFELVVQVNGKVRDKITVASDISEDEALKIALASEKVQKWTEGKNPASVKYVPGRILNIIP